jgi:diguanylate cyclase (GGDEF)-like protein/putative nucleotidyltransferase with HDIG domain
MINNIEASRLYTAAVSIFGIVVFLVKQNFHFFDAFGSPLSHAFLGAIILLSCFKVTIPPYQVNFSLDSSVYLAILFLSGPNLALDILFIHFIIFAVLKRENALWKSLFNFASSTLTILLSHGIFIGFGGKIGEIETSNLLPYVLALSGYFSIHMILIILINCLNSTKESRMEIIKNFLKDKIFIISFCTILLFSLALGILIGKEGIFGLALFVCIAIMISLAYIKYFQLYQALSSKAKFDFLTGLYNHGSFKEILEQEVLIAKKMKQPLCLALIDLDDFKKYNDSFGHMKGDQLLSLFGRLIDSHAGTKHFIPARYGGEEFVILMPNTNSHDAFQFLNHFRKITNDTVLDGVDIFPYGCLSFSAGIAELEAGTFNTSELLNKADKAMYLAKAQGKNMVEIYQESLAKSTILLEDEIEKADQKLKLFLAKDVLTYRHSQRVCQYAADFSKRLKLCDHERQILILGALVHDIGKLEIPKDILHKKENLEPDEWLLVKEHVQYGKDIVLTIKEWEEVMPLVELHHERYDGKGYPYGFSGENIPKLARILCIIDSFDAMTTERPYQKTKTFEEAFEELRACSGHQFDSRYVEPFIQMIQEQNELNKEDNVAI